MRPATSGSSSGVTCRRTTPGTTRSPSRSPATRTLTGALRPKVAVALSGLLNLVGAFLSVEVALTVTNAVVKIQDSSGAPQSQLTDDGGRALLMIVSSADRVEIGDAIAEVTSELPSEEDIERVRRHLDEHGGSCDLSG